MTGKRKASRAKVDAPEVGELTPPAAEVEDVAAQGGLQPNSAPSEPVSADPEPVDTLGTDEAESPAEDDSPASAGASADDEGVEAAEEVVVEAEVAEGADDLGVSVVEAEPVVGAAVRRNEDQDGKVRDAGGNPVHPPDLLA